MQQRRLIDARRIVQKLVVSAAMTPNPAIGPRTISVPRRQGRDAGLAGLRMASDRRRRDRLAPACSAAPAALLALRQSDFPVELALLHAHTRHLPGRWVAHACRGPGGLPACLPAPASQVWRLAAAGGHALCALGAAL